MTDCLFCKIIKGEIPSTKIYEDDNCYAFLDINPVNPGHILVVPKKHSEDIFDIDENDLKNLIVAVKKVAVAVVIGVDAHGCNIQLNNKPASGQVIFHTHYHIVPRFEGDGLRLWPGKPYEEGQDKEIQKRILDKF